MKQGFVISFAGCLFALAGLCRATGPSTPASKESQPTVVDVLKRESSGDAASRKPALIDILRRDPNDVAARWQAGQVKLGVHWQNYRTVPESMKRDRTIRKYRTVRDRYPMTAQGQRELADWCRDHALPERERAHLTAALELSKDPNDPVLRKRLGWRRVNGTWVKQSDLATSSKAFATLQKNRKAWLATLRRQVLRLNSRRKDLREAAVRELKSIADPDAIPALEFLLANGPEEHGRLLVELLAGMKTHHAADSLARVAVLSRWESVRQAASRKLRSRPIETFAPELMAALRTPIQSRIGLYVGQGGVHLVHYATSETQREVQAFAGRSSTIINPVGGGGTNSLDGVARQRNRVARAAANAAIQNGLAARQTERAVAQRNEAVKAWNDRICAVLKEGTGVVLPADPKQWWEWWDDYNQLSSEGETEKEYRCYYYYQTRVETVDVSEPTVTPEIGTPVPAPVSTPRECLVAGTPIWTDRGFVNVEDVKVGDLVLAKNAASGELRFQPVLRTTVRSEEAVLKVTTDEGTIRATGGHTFWISGKGWTKLKLAKPGDRFHTATGTAVIQRLEKDGREKMFNLLVADVHTYFVGRQMVLSHDVTFAEPTDTIVPGLSIVDLTGQPKQLPARLRTR